jgi:hypothetical protein
VSVPENHSNPMMIMHDMEGFPAGTQGTEWPAHITVVPFFTAEAGRESEIVDVVGTIGREVGSFPLRARETAWYGPNNDIQVTKIDDVEGGLRELHVKLVNGLGTVGCQFADLSYALDNYSPHSSHTGRDVLPAETFVCDVISVVQKLPKTTPANKLILDVVRLDEE